MRTRDFALLALDAMGGEVKGKTLFQKRIYFLGLLADQLDELGYVAHYYGPYSSEVAEAASEMQALGFLSETQVGCGATNAWGFEVARSDFELTKDGKKVVELLKSQEGDLPKRIADAWAKVRDAGDLSYMQLAIAAKVFYVLQLRGGSVKREEIAQIAKKFGWTISQDDVAKAEAFLLSLDVIDVEPVA